MRNIIGRTFFHPALSLGSTLLWGILEFIALQRSRLADSGPLNKRRAP